MLYVIQAENGMIKIGCSKYPYTRCNALQFNSPLQLRLIAIFEGDGRDEHKLHARFEPSRRHNEWFAPDGDVVRFVADVWGRGLDRGVNDWITDFTELRVRRRQELSARLSENARKRWRERQQCVGSP